MEIATAERAEQQAWYEAQVEEHHEAIAALDECLVLLGDLKNPSPTMVQIKKAKVAFKRAQKKLESINNKYVHLMKALIKLAQNFSDQGTLDKIMNKMVEVQQNLRDSLITMADDNAAQISTFNTYMAVCAQTIVEAEQRIIINTEDLAQTVSLIADEEAWREVRESDLAAAHEDMDAETLRWDEITAIHLDLIAQLNDELGAVNDCIDVFASFEVSDSMKADMNK